MSVALLYAGLWALRLLFITLLLRLWVEKLFHSLSFFRLKESNWTRVAPVSVALGALGERSAFR